MPEAACVMRVHEVMRCGHVQEWPPGQRVHDRLGIPWELWVCSLTWLVSETPSSVTENRILTCCEPVAAFRSVAALVAVFTRCCASVPGYGDNV